MSNQEQLTSETYTWAPDAQGAKDGPGMLAADPLAKCKHGEAGCGQYYDCGLCAREKRARAYRRLTPEQKAYDRHVDPAGAYHTDFDAGCSCHLNAPCSYCTRDTEQSHD